MQKWVFGRVAMSQVVPQLDSKSELPLEVVEQDAPMLTIGAICSLAVVGYKRFVGFLTDCQHFLVDLELNNDDLDVLREIQESNRGEKRSQLRLDSLSLTLHSCLQSRSIS